MSTFVQVGSGYVNIDQIRQFTPSFAEDGSITGGWIEYVGQHDAQMNKEEAADLLNYFQEISASPRHV